jgi:hypothetical protein
MNSCKAIGSCRGMKPRKDLIANPKFKKVMSEYGQGTLKSSNGYDVNSPQQAKAIAASESGQANNGYKKNNKSDRFGIRKK